MLSARRLITSSFGIAGVFGGGGIGLASLLTGSSNSFPIKPLVTKDGKILERNTNVDLDFRVVAEYVHKDEQNKEICEMWKANDISRKHIVEAISEESCKEKIKEIFGSSDSKNPIKWFKSEDSYISNLLKKMFSRSSLGEDPEEQYSINVKDNQWTFNDEWLCKNSKDSEKETVSCEKVGKEKVEEFKKRVSSL
ncbi:hypothetical protein [Mycoplasma suis]|uniref:Uncharacterized protein n=1 Tax=Mycoplasma suis (strain Illinois) TaxID=768700 RepID=F0QQI6_MYCSL|nr:hypothetical protein [Mycoplasma suis]ADX97756.1 hypothetical protein MSU_0212 [Mycoplasma suis str. Illinois]